MSKQRLLFITTGGTIASVRTQQGLKPVLSSEELLAHLPELKELCCPETLALCSIDSTDLGQEHWLMMHAPFRKTTPCTMALSSATARIRWRTLRRRSLISSRTRISPSSSPARSSPSPTRSPTQEKPAGQRGLRHRPGQPGRDGGVWRARHRSTRAKKNKTISYDAFASVNFPELALVQGDRLVRYIPSPWPTGPVEFSRTLDSRVFLLKLTPGMSPALIPEIFHLYDCVIVESFGVGGIPQQLMDAFAAGLGDYETTHKVLIMTTQVTYEGSDVGVYEVGKRVRNRFRFLEAHDMTIEP